MNLRERQTGAEVRLPQLRVGGWRPALLMVAGWCVVNVVWLQVNRPARLLELDEAGYTTLAVRVGRGGTGGGWWSTLQDGFQGPMQSLLAAPQQWLAGTDGAVLFWQNTALTAATALVVFWMARRLAGKGAGWVACGVVLACPGGLDYGRSALTVTPATFFATVAFGSVIAGRGLRSTPWAVLAGAAVGAMALSRSMAIVFAVPVAVAALAYARHDRTPWRRVAANGVAAVAAATLVSGWWWASRATEVVDYLSTGSVDAEAEAIANPLLLVPIHLFELAYYMGIILPVVMGVGYLVLRRGSLNDAPASHSRMATGPALWPLWAAAGAGVAVLLVSSVVPRGGVMPLVPVVLVAAVGGARRGLAEEPWHRWAGAVVVTAVALGLFVTVRGPKANHVWCSEPLPDARTTCEVTDGPGQRAWRAAIDELENQTFNAWSPGGDRPRREPPMVALATRDWLVNANNLILDAELDHRWDLDDGSFFDPDQSPSEQISTLARRAPIVVVVPDDEAGQGGPNTLGRTMPAPGRIRTRLLDANFTTCGRVQLPDGRVAVVLGSPALLGCPSEDASRTGT